MFILGPNDSPINESKSSLTHSNFGGRRTVTSGTGKPEDYTRRNLERTVNMAGEIDEKVINPVFDTVKDIDDLADLTARKREFSRRAETSTLGDHNKEHFFVVEPFSLE